MSRLRGLVLILWMYALMAAMGLVCTPLVALGPRSAALRVVQLYSRIVLASARLLCGLRVELRGEVPRGEVLVASKHQSFLDILILAAVLEQPRFVMKRSLVWAPVLGFYARRIGCVAVDRGAGGRAVRAMVRESSAFGGTGQLVIYPQGTRVAPGAPAPYRGGVAALQAALELPCVPAATNAGVFWPRRGLSRRPGAAVLAFLDPIPPGLSRADLMARLEGAIEPASERLLAEARGEGAQGEDAPRDDP